MWLLWLVGSMLVVGLVGLLLAALPRPSSRPFVASLVYAMAFGSGPALLFLAMFWSHT